MGGGTEVLERISVDSDGQPEPKMTTQNNLREQVEAVHCFGPQGHCILNINFR